MTDRELADAAWAEFMLTTDSYPRWVSKGKPSSSHWAKGKVFLDKIGVVAPPPPPAPSGLRRVVVPSYSSAAKVVTSLAAATDALRNDLGGGELVIRGDIQIPANAIVFNRDYGGKKVWFEGGARFVGADASAPQWAGCGFGSGVKNLSAYGLDVTNPAGWGVHVQGGTANLTIVGKVHGVGSTGFFTTTAKSSGSGGGNGDVVNLDVDLDIFDCGNKLSTDPHAEVGTGIHPFYVGGTPDSNHANWTRDSKFTLLAHDCDTGAGQVGSNVHDCEFWVDARRLNKVALSQTGGNALQFWGGELRNIIVRYAYGEDLQGRVIDANGIYASVLLGQVRVEYARGLRCCLNPALNEPIPNDEYFDPRFGTVYVDKAKLG